MFRSGAVLGVVMIIGVLGAMAIFLRAPSQTKAPQDAAESPLRWLANAGEGHFGPPSSSWQFRFPADHGPHRDFRTEWWYLTGSVGDGNGRRLGLQLVLVRLGLTAQSPPRPSRWAATEVYAGLFSVSDLAVDRLHSDQRVSRAALGLAGAGAQPMRIWVEDWRLQQTGLGADRMELAARAATEEVTMELQLRSSKPLVHAGEIRGSSAESPLPFHFYVQPRLRAEGTLRMGEQQAVVEGTASLEHAWGELPLPGGAVALDRFTLHLDDGRDLFFVHRHRADGSGMPRTTGLLLDPNGPPRVLSSAEVELEPTEHWVSQLTGGRYPIRWVLRLHRQGIELKVTAYGRNQEGVGWAPFWAGPVRLHGTSGEGSVSGEGFAQLNGYQRL